MTIGNFGFSVDLNSTFNTSRFALRIHPDGNAFGTQGCIGLRTNVPQLRSFYNTINLYFQRVNPNIPLNVNY